MRFNLLFIFIGLFVVASVSAPQFLTTQNMANLLQQSSLSTGIVAIGMTVVIPTSGIDLSVGSVAALSGMLVAIFIGIGLPWPVAMALAIGSGLVLGGVMGGLSAYLVLPAFMVILAGMQSIRGMTYSTTNGTPTTAEIPIDLRFLGAGSIARRYPGGRHHLRRDHPHRRIMLRRTTFGEHIYAVGSNAQAARLSGLPVQRITTAAYVISGGLAALTGVLLTARLTIGPADRELRARARCHRRGGCSAGPACSAGRAVCWARSSRSRLLLGAAQPVQPAGAELFLPDAGDRADPDRRADHELPDRPAVQERRLTLGFHPSTRNRGIHEHPHRDRRRGGRDDRPHPAQARGHRRRCRRRGGRGRRTPAPTSVCVSPSMLPITVPTTLKVAVVCGFPSGKHTSAVKATEAAEAVRNGADEIDMVIDHRRRQGRRFRSGCSEADIAAVRAAAPARWCSR